MKFDRQEYREKVFALRNLEPLSWDDICTGMDISMFTLRKFLKTEDVLRHLVIMKIKCWIDNKLQGKN